VQRKAADVKNVFDVITFVRAVSFSEKQSWYIFSSSSPNRGREGKEAGRYVLLAENENIGSLLSSVSFIFESNN